MKSSLLIGNGFSVLAAAVELAEKGQQVTLLTDGKTLGGHFAGLQINGLDFDIGMVLLEENSAAESGANLRSYDPRVRNDWTRFGGRASAWIRSKIDLTKAKTPECLIEGRRVPDYLISNRLDGLKDIPTPDYLPQSDPRHAAHKCERGVFDKLTYAEAATWNHSQLWHQRYVEPFVQKVFGVTSADFLARYHRAAWAPLYYPETLKLANLGNPTGLAEYPFWTTTNGHVGQLIKNLSETLKRLQNVSIFNQPIASIAKHNNLWNITTEDGRDHCSARLAISLSPDRAGRLFGVPVAAPLPAATVSLLFVSVEAARIRSIHGCTMIVDDSYATYRLTDHDSVAGLSPSWHRIVLEASPQRITRLHPGKTIELALLGELAKLLGMDLDDERDKSSIRILRSFTAQNSLPIPTLEQVVRASQTASLLANAAPGAILTGNLLGYGVASLNDQLIQAFKISEEFA
jgi:predicted NAD/FAD-dependent oxidoreductase